MKKITVTLILAGVLLAGCESLRFAPGESQKQNAWLHNRTAMAAAQTAKDENASKKLQSLTGLSELQSRPFVAYYGMPKECPPAETAEQILAESNVQLAQTALSESVQRPDIWQVADETFGLAIGICGLLGGVYGTRAIRFLQDAQTKSKALKEIIQGNELFKQQNAEAAASFKQAQENQSTETKQIVAAMK